MAARPRRWKVVGWREWVSLPGLGVDRIKAKIDTGARTSSLHAFALESFERDGQEWVRFEVHPEQRHTEVRVPVEVPVVDRRWVKSSTGDRQFRPIIHTDLEIQGERWTIEVTLTRRDMMGFRLLLGRQALRGHIVVDPGRSFLTRKGLRHAEIRRPERA